MQATELKLQIYPNAREVFHSHEMDGDYVLALGSYKKVDSNWLVDRSQRLSGELDRTTLELPADHNAEDGFRFYKDQLNRLNLRELFHCKARDCGTSNSWANIHFKIIQLYGLDQYQFYAAYEITNADENPFYVVLYSVMRGNKRAYVQVEILHVNKADEFGVASSPETLNKLLDSNGYFVFPDLIGKDSNGAQRIQIKKAHVQALAALLSQQTKLKLALVGHDYSVATVEEQQKKSAQIAKQIKQALVDAGVGENRLQTYGVGGLAPAGRGDKNARVEIVKLMEN